MAYVVAANGHGGWPMSVFLTPQLLPIFGGTYFPPETARNVPSFLEVINQVAAAFSEQPSAATDTAEQVVEYLRGCSPRRLRRGSGPRSFTARPRRFCKRPTCTGRFRRRAEVPAGAGHRLPARLPQAHRRRART